MPSVYHLVGHRRYPLWPLGKLKVSVNSLLILSFVIQPSEHLSFAGRRVAIFSVLKPFVFCFWYLFCWSLSRTQRSGYWLPISCNSRQGGVRIRCKPVRLVECRPMEVRRALSLPRGEQIFPFSSFRGVKTILACVLPATAPLAPTLLGVRVCNVSQVLFEHSIRLHSR